MTTLSPPPSDTGAVMEQPADIGDNARVPIRRALFHLGIGLLVVLLAAEVAARIVGPGLPSTRYDKRTEQQLELLRNLPSAPDTLLIGASQVAANVDPEALASTSPGVDSAFVYWLEGGGSRSFSAVTRDVLIPRFEVRRILVGITAREFNENAAGLAALDREVRDAIGFRVDAGTQTRLDDLEEAVAEVSALIRYRRALRTPADLLRDPPPPLRITDRGRLELLLDASIETETEQHRAQEARALEDYRVGTEDMAELERLIEAATAAGVEVALIEMPVYEPEFRSLVADFDEIEATYREAVGALVARTGVRYLDSTLLDWSNRDLWADVDHLNRRGGDRFTQWLADAL
jgi:hypothetical protein